MSYDVHIHKSVTKYTKGEKFLGYEHPQQDPEHIGDNDEGKIRIKVFDEWPAEEEQCSLEMWQQLRETYTWRKGTKIKWHTVAKESTATWKWHSTNFNEMINGI